MNWVCPSVDTAAFKSSCQLPLLGGQWNVWRLIRTNRDGSSQPGGEWSLAQLEAEALDCLTYWGHEANPQLPDPLTAFTSLTISPDPPAVELQLLGDSTDPARRACFPSGIIAVSSVPGPLPNPELWISFTYQGSAKELPWPAFKRNQFGAFDWCPTDSDWIVGEAYTADPKRSGSGAEPSPPPEPLFKIPDVPKVIDPAQSLTGVVFWGGVGLFGAYVVANRIFGDE